MADWYGREEDALVGQYNNGEITDREYREAMRDLNEELRQGAEDAAEEARNDYYGGGW